MSNIDKRALREAAEKATPGNWWIDSHGQAMVSFIDGDVLEVFAIDNKRAAVRHEDTGNLSRWRNDNDATFIATANPATVLALLDELEAKDNRINRLEAIVTVAEQRNAIMREWKRALKVPCDLVDNQVPVVIHGMVIRLERLKEVEAKLEAAEKRIAELEELEELFLRAKALMHQSGGTPIESSLNPIDAWLYDAEHAAAAKGE